MSETKLNTARRAAVPDLGLKIGLVKQYGALKKPAKTLRIGNDATTTRAMTGEADVSLEGCADILAGWLEESAPAHAPLAALRREDLAGWLASAVQDFWGLLDRNLAAAWPDERMAAARRRASAAFREELLTTGLPPTGAELRAFASDIEAPGRERWLDLDEAQGSPGAWGQPLPPGGRFTLTIPAHSHGQYRLWVFELPDTHAEVMAGRISGKLEMLRWAGTPGAYQTENGPDGPVIVFRKVPISPVPGAFAMRIMAAPVDAPAPFDPERESLKPRQLDAGATWNFLRKVATARKPGDSGIFSARFDYRTLR